MNKEKLYKEALTEIISVWDDKIQLIGNLSNVCAVLKNKFNFWWVGFYEVVENELQLSTFQGPVACTKISKGKGVCGTAWQNNESIIVPNVHEFDGHIACNSESNSEIVIPVRYNNSVWGVLDIDSKEFDSFQSTDKNQLEEIVDFISNKIA